MAEDDKSYRGRGSNCPNSEAKEVEIEDAIALKSKQNAIADVQEVATRRNILVLKKGIRCDLSLLEDPDFQKRAREFRMREVNLKRHDELRKNIIRLTVFSVIGFIVLICVFIEFR